MPEVHRGHLLGGRGRVGGERLVQQGVQFGSAIGEDPSRVFEQPVGGLNVGTIEVELDGDDARLDFKLYGEDEHSPEEPKLLFESGFQ